MVKKVKNPKKSKEVIKENKNLSSVIKNIKTKLFSKRKNNFAAINTSVVFKTTSNPSLKEKFENEYHKRFLFYIKEEFNSKVVTMFFNYITTTTIIPNKFKNNRYFLQEFLKIIVNLLINEIDLVTMTLILDNIGWINEGSDPWQYIYYVCLFAKEKASSENSYTILTQILEKNNPGFIDSFNKWLYKINSNKKIKGIEISKTNERFRELMRPIHLNEDQKKFINYNDIVNKIVLMNKQKENIDPTTNQIDTNYPDANLPNTLITQINTQFKPIIENSSFRMNNKGEIPAKFGVSNLDLQKQNSSFKLLDLSRGASKNSFMGVNSFDADLYNFHSMRFNNK
jgi:hypothetical protein